MNRPIFIGIFADEHDIVEATDATRRAGYQIHDVYTPYAVHGLDKAMGLRNSRLTWVCFAFAFVGFALALIVQYWIGAIDWPLNVGGKPFNSLPAYLPVMFELTVLFGGLGVLATLFVRTKLAPGKVKWQPYQRITDDRFVLAVEETDAAFDEGEVHRLWQSFGVLETQTFSEGAS